MVSSLVALRAKRISRGKLIINANRHCKSKSFSKIQYKTRNVTYVKIFAIQTRCSTRIFAYLINILTHIVTKKNPV